MLAHRIAAQFQLAVLGFCGSGCHRSTAYLLVSGSHDILSYRSWESRVHGSKVVGLSWTYSLACAALAFGFADGQAYHDIP
jgi:hypothetical protein